MNVGAPRSVGTIPTTVLLAVVLTFGSPRPVAAEELRSAATSQVDLAAAFARAKEEWRGAFLRARASQSLPKGVQAGATPDPFSPTPEMLAVEQTFIARLRALVGEASVDKIASPKVPSPVFAEAVRLGMVNAVQALVAAGADPNDPATIPLRHAVRRGLPEMVQTLLRAGADPNARPKDPLSDTRTPLLVEAAARSRLHPEGVLLVRALLEHGADVDSVVVGGPWSGQTPLIEAARRGNIEIVELLLAKGADANHIVPHNGHTALMSGAGYPDVAATLLKNGAKLKTKDHAKRTAIIFAAMTGCEPAVEFLRGRGGDMKQRDVHGKSAGDYLRDFGKDSVKQGVCAPKEYQ